MKTMNEKYIPTWERNYDKWDTEPEVWDTLDVPAENKDEDIFYLKFMQSLDEMPIEEMELIDEETDVTEQMVYYYGTVTFNYPAFVCVENKS